MTIDHAKFYKTLTSIENCKKKTFKMLIYCQYPTLLLLPKKGIFPH